MCPITRPVGVRPFSEAAPTPPPQRIVLCVLSHGRPDVLSRNICALTGQSRMPDDVILAVTGEADIDRTALSGLPFPVHVLIGPRNALARRNKVLDRLKEGDIVQFQTEDLLLKPDHLALLDHLFATQPQLGLIEAPVSRMPLDEDQPPRLEFSRPDPAIYTADLFALRARLALRHEVRFDAALLPDGPLATADFFRRLTEFGRQDMIEELGVMRDGKRRDEFRPGKVLGYAQIAEPMHLAKSGHISGREARAQIKRCLAANLFRLPRFGSPPHKRERLRGNLRALGHMAIGRLDPQRAEPV